MCNSKPDGGGEADGNNNTSQLIGRKSFMGKIKTQDLEAMMFLLQKNASKTNDLGGGLHRLTYTKIQDQIYLYPKKAKKIIQQLEVEERIKTEFGRSVDYIILKETSMTETQYEKYRENAIKKSNGLTWSDLLYDPNFPKPEPVYEKKEWRASEAMQARLTNTGTTFIHGCMNNLSVHESFELSKKSEEYRPAGEKAGKRKEITIW